MMQGAAMTKTVRVKFLDSGEVRDVVPDRWNELYDNPMSGAPRLIAREPVINGYTLERLMEPKDFEYFAKPAGGPRGFL